MNFLKDVPYISFLEIQNPPPIVAQPFSWGGDGGYDLNKFESIFTQDAYIQI